MASSIVLFAQNRPRRALLNQALPILLGQLAVMGNGLVDTLMAGQAGPDVLAAMAVGSSIYISLYVGLMGVIIGLTPFALPTLALATTAKLEKTPCKAFGWP
jgi:multidrug resistance protein, MATE family